MKIREIIQSIEKFAPLALQESYDNCGIQVGNPEGETNGVLLCLEVTEKVLEEALEKNCQLIIAHHPLIFSGLKNITGKNYVERILLKAIKNNITIYAAHTNMDNVKMGVNQKIGEKLGLQNLEILAPIKNNLSLLYVYIPNNHFESVQNSLFAAGAGKIGDYSEAGFSYKGIGSFKPSELAHPTIGKAGEKREQVEETKLEVIIQGHNQSQILNALFENHPYEEVAYGIIPLSIENQEIGAGMIGFLPEPIETLQFLKIVKENMQTDCIRHTNIHKSEIEKVAICGGSGSFLLKDAIRQRADILITGDFKYHQFFDADNQIIIADIGHFESEQFTMEIFYEIIRKNFRNFATHLTMHKTNPINYYF